jgi:hypothetical protein
MIIAPGTKNLVILYTISIGGVNGQKGDKKGNPRIFFQKRLTSHRQGVKKLNSVLICSLFQGGAAPEGPIQFIKRRLNGKKGVRSCTP